MKKFVVLMVSVVLLLSLAVPVGAQAPSPGSGTNYGAVQNVDETGVASFRQDFYDQTGQLDAYRELANVAYGNTMGLTTNAVQGAPLSQELPTGWVGSSVVSSDREAAAVVILNYIGGSVGSDGLTSADYSGVLVPGSDNFCPSVGKRNAEDTTIVVMNTSGASVSDVSISFKNRSGVDVGTAMTGITIPAYAQKTFNLFDAAFALPADFLGAARVQSAGGTPLAVIAITQWGAGASAFGTYASNCQATTAGATTLYAPKVQRRHPAGWANWQDSTGIVVVNTEGTDATARIEFYDRAGAFSGVFTDTIAAYSARGYNTEYYGQADHAAIDALIGTGTAANPFWQGSAVVKSVTGQKLVGVVKQGYESDFWAAGYNMLSDSDAGSTWFFPLVYRRGFNRPWTDYAGIICQNISAAAVTPVVEFVSRSATAAKCTPTTTTCEFTDAASMAQYVSHGYNTRYGGSVPGGAAWFGATTGGGAGTGANLPDNFLGAAFITASSPIVCVQETWFEEMQDLSGTWHTGGDSNLNNVYGK